MRSRGTENIQCQLPGKLSSKRLDSKSTRKFIGVLYSLCALKIHQLEKSWEKLPVYMAANACGTAISACSTSSQQPKGREESGSWVKENVGEIPSVLFCWWRNSSIVTKININESIFLMLCKKKKKSNKNLYQLLWTVLSTEWIRPFVIIHY